MKRPLSLIVYITAILLLVGCSAIIVFKLMFWPPCVPTGPKDSACLVDGWSVAGLAATVLGVAAAILALLGAFAVAAWWSELDKRVGAQVSRLFHDQTADLNSQVDALLAKQSTRIQEAFANLKNVEDLVKLQQTVTKSIEDGQRASLFFLLGNYLLERRKVAEAVDMYGQVKALQPDDPQVNYILGRVYRDIGDYDRAIVCLETSLLKNPDFAPAHFELGMAYRNHAEKVYFDVQDELKHEAEDDQAIEHLKRAIQLQPQREEFLGALGGTYRRAKDYRRAFQYYQQAYALHPDHPSSYVLGNLAILAWHKGDLEEARKACAHTEDLATKGIKDGIEYEPYWNYYDRGMARLVLGHKADALADYRKAIELTGTPEHLKAVLDGIIFLKETAVQYPIDGLDEAFAMVQDALTRLEARMTGQYVL